MRILKLSDGHVWLCEGINALPQYACLSHCWGPKGPALKLNSETMDELTAGICVDRLPKTFHDAVVLCLNLSIQYLWIDALCMLYHVSWGELKLIIGMQAYCRITRTTGSELQPQWQTYTQGQPSQLRRHGLMIVMVDVSHGC